MKYTTDEIRQAVIAELNKEMEEGFPFDLTIQGITLRFINNLLDAAFKRLPDRLPVCWSCGKPIKYHENGKPHWHCECGAGEPAMPDDTKTMDDRLSTDVSGSLCCQCGLRKKAILDKCISCNHGWTEKSLEEDWSDDDDDDDDSFEPCSDCDLPDACCDYAQCAIRAGIRKDSIL